MKKYPFEFKNVHDCEAVVLGCIDFRFWEAMISFAKNELEIKSFDLATVAGGAKEIVEHNELIDGLEINIPVSLHHVGKVVVVNHSDCGAYGGLKRFSGDREAEFIFHKSELLKAKDYILKKHSSIEVILAFARLVDNDTAVEFEVI